MILLPQGDGAPVGVEVEGRGTGEYAPVWIIVFRNDVYFLYVTLLTHDELMTIEDSQSRFTQNSSKFQSPMRVFLHRPYRLPHCPPLGFHQP